MSRAGGVPGECALPDDAKDLDSHRSEFRLAFRGWMHYPQPTHRRAKPRRRVRAKVTPDNVEGRRARAPGRLHLASADHKKTQ